MQKQKEYEENRELLKVKNNKKQEEELKKMILDDEVFPSLCVTKSKEKCKELCYIEKIKDKKMDMEKIKDTKNEKKGWITLELDDKRNVVYDKSLLYKNNEDDEEIVVERVIETLVNLYERRKEDYINCWGIDEYEKMFMFPNYDYHYFDRLDEKYEEEMKK